MLPILSEDANKNERSLSEVELKKLKPILDYLETHGTIVFVKRKMGRMATSQGRIWR